MAEPTREERSHERHTGAQSKLKISDGPDGTNYEIPITNVDWTRDVEVDDIQHNNSLSPTLATTGLRYNGSFEYEGQNLEAMDQLIQQDEGGEIQENRPQRVTITIKEYDHDDPDQEVRTITFYRCIVESNDRTLPSDEVSSATYDFQAEDMSVDNEV